MHAAAEQPAAIKSNHSKKEEITMTSNNNTKNIAGLAVVLSASVLLGGCMATNPARDLVDVINSTTAGDPTSTRVNIAPITLKVPNDPGIQQRKPAPYTTVIVRDVGYDSRSVTMMPGAMYSRLRYEALTPTTFTMHVRTDNGMSGSGIRYQVGYSVRENGHGYEATFAPSTRSTYQEGLIGRFPLPNFTDENLRQQLGALQLVYKFEVDSPYNTDSVTANFMRNAEVRTDRQGFADPVTGKIYSTYYVAKLNGRNMPFVVQVFPYRNGSKAVIHATIPGQETSPNTVDFGVLIKDARRMLEGVARS